MTKLYQNTPAGTLVSCKKMDSSYPGFYVDLRTPDGELLPVCNIEYDSNEKRVRVVIYANQSSDEPTHLIDLF